MLQTVLNCDCDCGCQSELKWGDDKWGARPNSARRYGWDLSWPVRCPGCVKWCNPGPQLTWWEVSVILTAINRAEIPPATMLGKAIARLEDRLTWLTEDNVKMVIKAENARNPGLEEQRTGQGGFQIVCSFAPKNDRPS